MTNNATNAALEAIEINMLKKIETIERKYLQMIETNEKSIISLEEKNKSFEENLNQMKKNFSINKTPSFTAVKRKIGMNHFTGMPDEINVDSHDKEKVNENVSIIHESISNEHAQQIKVDNNNCGICEKTFKSTNFLKNHDKKISHEAWQSNHLQM